MPRKQTVNVIAKALTPSEVMKAHKAAAGKSSKPDAGDQPKLTQEQAIAQAFLVLKNAGLLPVSLEAKPSENADRIAEQKGVLNVGVGLSTAPGVVLEKVRIQGPVETRIDDLRGQLVEGNNELTKLLDTLQPYLPLWLFEPQDDCVAKDDSDFEWQPTSGGSMSQTECNLNGIANELNLLRRRVRKLTSWVVR